MGGGEGGLGVARRVAEGEEPVGVGRQPARSVRGATGEDSAAVGCMRRVLLLPCKGQSAPVHGLGSGSVLRAQGGRADGAEVLLTAARAGRAGSGACPGTQRTPAQLRAL